MPARREGGSPLRHRLKQKVPCYGLSRGDSYHAPPPFLPDTSFRQGVGRLGKVHSPKFPGDENEWTPTPKADGLVCGAEPPRDTTSTKSLRSCTKTSQALLQFCSLKHSLHLASKPKSEPKPNTNLNTSCLFS